MIDGLRSPEYVGVLQLRRLVRFAITASFIVVAALTGMRLSDLPDNLVRAAAKRGTKRHGATEQALRDAWHRLRTGTPTHPELIGRRGQLSISAVCIEAGCSRNAFYDGHPKLLEEIRATIARQRHVTGTTRYGTKRSGVEVALADCRADSHRLVSGNAALLLRALAAEEALAALKRGIPRPLKMTDDTPEAS